MLQGMPLESYGRQGMIGVWSRVAIVEVHLDRLELVSGSYHKMWW